MPPNRRTFSLGLALGALLQPAFVAALDRPTGRVLLTISGNVRQTNQDDRAAFDMAMLQALPQVSFVVRTPWFAQPRKFTGPLLRDVLKAVGAQGQTVRALALNDYRVDIPFGDPMRYDIIIARLMDDQPMLVRDKGPLFVMYPFDREPELRTAVYFGRCAWQLKALEIL